MQNLQYLIALHSVDGLGPIRLKKILDYFEDAHAAWTAELSEYRKLGIPQNTLEVLKEKRKTLDPESYLSEILKRGIKILTIFDEDYPPPLKQIHNPPLVLFYKGEILKRDNFAFGVVGTRKITQYGAHVTEQFTQGLVAAGFTIISGLARGVDTVAHRAALKAEGRTLAVLGGGVDTIFPPENNSLAKQIADGHGAYLSEYPPTYPHLPGNFPARNRIISGLSKAVLVTEAAEDSGSLITAHLAIDQGREVFAVPGPITSTVSKGPSNLIKDGAKLASNIDDILDELNIDPQKSSQTQSSTIKLSEVEKAILNCLETEGLHIDEICRQANLKVSDVSSALLKMEIMGLVKNMGGGNYIKT